MASKNEDNSCNQSDLDDWTLVSPPHSSSSSPDREKSSPIGYQASADAKSSSNSSLEHVDEDGLTEIDLSGTSKPSKPRVAVVAPTAESDGRSSSTEPSIQGFQPLDTTTDDEYEENSSSSRQNSSRSSTSDHSEFADYVDFGMKNKSTKSAKPDINNESTITLVKQPSKGSNNLSEKQITCLSSLKSKLDELSDAAQILQRDKTKLRLSRLCRGSSSVWRVPMKQWILLHLFILTLHIILNYILILSRQNNHLHNHQQDSYKKSDNNFSKLLDNLMDDFGKSIPTSQQYAELELLHNELSQCIKRQSPSSYKYYMSEDRFKDDPSTKHTKNYKSYRGLVCYGQETQWRKRFEKLKSKHNLDLRRLVQEAKKRVTNELLEFYHPTLQFKLILNQIEYLDFIETKRTKKQSEELVKYLKAENHQLLRRLNQPNETGYQKLVVSLELENSRLQRENEALKANLGQKAGPIYIKQSIELEQYERENIILKQFQYQVAQEVSKSLKQFNLHTIDASTILDDQESLNSQLMLTRGYLRRLREKIATVLIENEGLKEELKEVYLSTITNKANLPATSNAGSYSARHNNNSNGLMADNCTRSSIEIREKNVRLQEELDRLRQECTNGLERCSCRDLHADNENVSQQLDLEWKQLGAQETALDKHASDSLSLMNHNDDIMDELMLFLTKFNTQIESNGLAVVDHDQHNMHDNAAGYLGNEKLNVEPKVIPNYIREAVRAADVGNVDSYNNKARVGENLAHLKLPPTPPPMYTPAHRCGTNTSRSSSIVGNHQPFARSQPEVRQSISVESVENRDLYSRAAQDTWFFKRAKQRKQLRGPKIGVKPQNDDWMMKRATLREKLRKATSYIDDHNIANNYLRCQKNNQVSNSKYNRKMKNTKSDGFCKRRKKHDHKQHNQRKKHYKDEL